MYKRQALGKRLPSEAEWEKVARDQTEGAYPFEGGAEFLPDYGWFRKNSGGLMHIAAEKTPNSYGVYDTLGMHGNGSLTVSAFISFATKTIRRDPKPEPIGCFVAVPGTILRTI